MAQRIDVDCLSYDVIFWKHFTAKCSRDENPLVTILEFLTSIQQLENDRISIPCYQRGKIDRKLRANARLVYCVLGTTTFKVI